MSDFLGGLQSRRMPVLAVLAVTQPVGLVIALAIIPLGADPIPAGDLALAFVGGAAGMGALAAFYTALAMGTMSVVAPIAALGVVVPVGYGLALGESPEAIQFGGLVAAIVGVVILSYEEDANAADSAGESSSGRRSIVLALLAAFGFGVFFTLLDHTAADQPGWAIFSARAGGVVAVLGAAAIVRPEIRAIPGAIVPLVAIGFFDILANTLFAVASTKGLLPIVAVGGSMYPAFTIFLAHLVVGERLGRAQRAGVALALCGVLLIAAGG